MACRVWARVSVARCIYPRCFCPSANVTAANVTTNVFAHVRPVIIPGDRLNGPGYSGVPYRYLIMNLPYDFENCFLFILLLLIH